MRNCFLLLRLLLFLMSSLTAAAFSPLMAPSRTAVTPAVSSLTSLNVVRKPRRDLKKRSRRGRPETNDSDDEFWQTAEVRPLVKGNAIEQGLDYWIDEEELKRSQEKSRRAPAPTQIPEEKLWIEILSPYKQNWIGLISVTIVVLTFLVKTFPELTEYPIIPVPDL
jgi:hypothetical protein